MSELRDAFAAKWMEITLAWGDECDIPGAPAYAWEAEQLLSMPEMQAIKAALHGWAEYAGSYDCMGAEYALREMLGSPLPDSVIEWVLS